jgi:SSS family solute:Na+ symporter
MNSFTEHLNDFALLRFDWDEEMIDQIIVGIYLVITIVVGLYVGRNTKTLEDFAIGPRNFSTIVLVSTVFASVVDAGMTTGLASSTYSIGPIFLLSFLGIILSNFTLSFFIAPKMKPFLGLLSSGDIFEKLYGKRAKTLMGCSTIIESTLTTAIQIFAIAQIGQYFFGLQPLAASLTVSLIIVIYTFRGGIRSVTATDVFQFGIMIIAIPIMCGFALTKPLPTRSW